MTPRFSYHHHPSHGTGMEMLHAATRTERALDCIHTVMSFSCGTTRWLRKTYRSVC